MDKDKCENVAFIIFKSIVVFISLCIAIFLIALFVAVSKVDAEIIPIDIMSLSGGTSGECSGSYDYVRVSCNGNYKKVWARFYDSQGILFVNMTHDFEVQMQVWGVSTTGVPNITKKIFVWNGSSYIQATPDRNESFTIRPIEGNYTRFQALWTFELDSTIDTQFMTIEFEMTGGSFTTLRDYTLNIIYPTDDGTRQLISAIGQQTNSINQNNNENTTIIDNSINNQGQAITGKLNDINNTLNNDTVSSGRGSTIVNGISSNAGSGLAGIINTPLGVISGLLQQNTCTDIVAPLPFVNKNLTLPCLTPIYEDKFGSFFNMYQVIITGIVAYWVTMNIFLKTKKMSMPDDDRIEVLDL